MNPYDFKGGSIISVVPEYDDNDIKHLNNNSDSNRSLVDLIRILNCVSNACKYYRIYVYNILHYGHTFMIFYISNYC